LIVAAVFHEVPAHRFVNFDDPMYLYQNGRVTAGLSVDGLWWAWTNKDALQWHPVTWMAHQTVSAIFGMRPGAHLVVNLAFHAASAVLLLRLLTSLTGAPGRSFAVALLFAVHPANVETAAWASQLKSTLSTSCALLGFLAWTWHVRGGKRGHALLAAGAFTLSLLAKPMLVTFPLLLLLLDFWPLRRLPAPPGFTGWLRGHAGWFLLAGAMAVVAALPWGSRPEMGNVVSVPDLARLTVVPVNYARYLGLMFHPTELAVLYPERLDHGWGETMGAIMLLAGISFAAWRLRGRCPALLFGWLWFLITLLPVCGIFRLGPQGWADRYLYVPGIGLLVAAIWPLADVVRPRVAVAAVAGATLLLGITSMVQATYWQNSLTLWRHALAVTPPSATGLINLGQGWLEAGHEAEAAREFEAALRLEPANPRPYINLGVMAWRQGQLDRAVALLRQASVLDARDARVLANLGAVLSDLGKNQEALAVLRQAVTRSPALFEARMNLGTVLVALGQRTEAEACFEEALRIRPGDSGAAHNLRLVRAGR